jgi:nucleoside phosphorylase
MPPTQDDTRVYFYTEIEAVMADGTMSIYKLAILCVAGMGRVKAATATADAIRAWRPPYVVVVGIAGGVLGEAELGDILIADQVADYEVQKVYPGKKAPSVRWVAHPSDRRLLNFAANFTDTSWADSVKGKRPCDGQCRRLIGTVATGDKVVAKDKLLRSYQKTWPKLIGVEMEAGGVATAAFDSPLKPGFFMVRAVSDLAENKDDPDVKAWRDYACHVAAAYAIALLKNGPIPVSSPPAIMMPVAGSLVALRDQLGESQPEIGFAELETVMGFVMDTDSSETSEADFTDLDPEKKLELNELSNEVRDLLTQGLRKAQLVDAYVKHTAKIHPKFPQRLAKGFKKKFESEEARGLKGDELFHSLLNFASYHSRDVRRQLAALSVLTYLFNICEVFRK